MTKLVRIHICAPGPLKVSALVIRIYTHVDVRYTCAHTHVVLVLSHMYIYMLVEHILSHMCICYLLVRIVALTSRVVRVQLVHMQVFNYTCA